jgi:hypothetical protein
MMLLNVIVIIIIAESQTPYFEDRQWQTSAACLEDRRKDREKNECKLIGER